MCALQNHLMMQMFGKSALINLEVLADKKIHISLGGAQLPREVLIDYQRSPPLLQSWIDLFYRTMEELWSEDIIDDSDAGDDSRGSEAVEGDLLKPEKLVASLTKGISLYTHKIYINNICNYKLPVKVEGSSKWP